jgi:hypothetical protein
LGQGPYSFNEEDLQCAKEPASCPHRDTPDTLPWEKGHTLYQRAVWHHLWLDHNRFLERQARREERARNRAMGIKTLGTLAPPDPSLPEGVDEAWWDELTPYQQEAFVRHKIEERRRETLRRETEREVKHRAANARARVWLRVMCAACASIGRDKRLSPNRLAQHYKNSRERGGNSAIRKAHAGYPSSTGETRREKHAPPPTYVRRSLANPRRIRENNASERTR